MTHLVHLVAGGIALIAISFLWTASLRRTPWQLLLLIPTGLSVFLTAGVALGAPENVTPIGITFAMIGTTLPVWFAAFCTEIAAHEHRSPVKHWREDRPKDKHKDSDGKKTKWEVNSYPTGGWESGNSTDVVVEIRRNGHARQIGKADPVNDYETYSELKVKAQDIADTYNQEGI
jgi:hypothetical protein